MSDRIKKAFSLLSISVTIVLLHLNAVGERPSGRNQLIIQLEHYVGNTLLRLDSSIYKNELGQIYTISKFKYYISGIQLIKKDGVAYVSPDYFLVSEDEGDSKQILLKEVPAGEYVSIHFLMGVDSLHNCSGAQSGALDPVNGMFWAWNTGYVFMKLEGNSPSSSSPGNIFEFHIGGYKEPNNCIRTIHLDFENVLVITGSAETSLLNIKTDVAEIFKSPVNIDFSKLSSVTDHHHATMVADNYKDMFSIMSVK